MTETRRDLGPLATFLGLTMLLVGAALVLVEVVHTERELFLPRLYVGGSTALLGTPLLLWSVLRKAGIVEDPNREWVAALRRLAAEHGQEVQSDPASGAWFDLIHGGPRFTVRVQPTKGLLTLRGARTARHGVVVLRRGERPEGEIGQWGEVLRGAAWSLRAEVRVAARPLAETPDLHRALDRFYSFTGAKAVRFDAEGFRLELELPPPEMTDRVVRNTLDAARAVSTAWVG